MTLTDPFYTMQDMRDSHTAAEFHRLAAESTSNFHRTGDPYHLALAEAADALAIEAEAASRHEYRCVNDNGILAR